MTKLSSPSSITTYCEKRPKIHVFPSIFFSGPSGLRDYRSHLPEYPHAVGIGDRSHETTSDLAYLSRKPPGSSFPLAKNGRIGEIGWPVETFKIVKGIWRKNSRIGEVGWPVETFEIVKSIWRICGGTVFCELKYLVFMFLGVSRKSFWIGPVEGLLNIRSENCCHDYFLKYLVLFS